jgi:DNA-binding CsgD family transcriptional regulator
MGTVTDTVLAEQYGLTRQRVQQFRQAMDIDPKNNGFHPTPEQVALLGTKSDSDLAREWGVSPFHVGQYRRNNGIPRWQVWDDHEEKIAPHKHLVGKISDPKVAALCGLSTRCVFEYRKRHNIKTEVLAPTHEDFSPIDREEIERLFNEEYSDNEIAEMMGCSAGTIGFIRSNELGLLRYKPSRPTTPGERERIKRVYENCGQNISETARRTDRSMSCVRKIVGR